MRISYYSGTKMATGGVWGWGKERSYMVFHPALQLVLFNGTPETRKMVLEAGRRISGASPPGRQRQDDDAL